MFFALSELEPCDHADRFQDWDTVGFGRFDDIEQSLFETCTVGDEHIGITHGGNLLC